MSPSDHVQMTGTRSGMLEMCWKVLDRGYRPGRRAMLEGSSKTS